MTLHSKREIFLFERWTLTRAFLLIGFGAVAAAALAPAAIMAQADTTRPVISSIVAGSITTSGAILTWTTNEASDSQVNYGLTTAYGSTSALDTNLVTLHTVAVTGLTPATLYHFRVRSRDGAGNLARSSDNTFTTGTLTTLDGTPPTISLTAPASGAAVVGTVTVTAAASDNVGVAGVQFRVDGAALGAEDSTAPYAVAWPTDGSTDSIFGVTKIVGAITISPGSSFAKRLSVSCPSCAGENMASEDKLQATAGSAAATFTFSAAAHYRAQMAAFKASGIPAYVQGASATTNTGSTTIAKAFASPTGAGSLIVVAVAWQKNLPPSVTDSQGNVYAVATTAYDAATDQSLAIFYAANVKSGATTVTAGFGSPAPTIQRLAIHEYSGIATTSPLDVTAMNIADGATTANNITSGAAMTTVMPPASPGAHTLTAVARDAAGNVTASAPVAVTVGGTSIDTTPPVISGVGAGSITTAGATLTWATNEASDSQVDYGTTTAYGSASALNASLVSSHTIALSGLAGTTLYHFRVRSRDAAGNLALSGDGTFTTRDGTPPTISLTAPSAGATVTGSATAVTATASDNVGVVGVQFRLDGALLGAEDTSSPYGVTWNTTTATNGSHVLTAVARDAAANQTTSASVGVTVSNPNATVQFTLAWDAVSDPTLTGYRVYVGTTSGVYAAPVNVGQVTTCTITGLQGGTLYYFVVSAYNPIGEGSRSNEVSGSR